MRKSKFYGSDGKRRGLMPGEKQLSSREVAEILQRKESYDTCKCGRSKRAKYQRCYTCDQQRKACLEPPQKSENHKEQLRLQKRFSPRRKNRKRSRIIDNFRANTDLSKLSKPNVPQYQKSVKTILRKLSPLHELSDEAECVSKLLKKLEEF